MIIKSAIIFTIVGMISGRNYYQDRIPNGHFVPNPCGTSQYWNTVGHLNPAHHTHLKNIFGNEFRANGHVWNQVFCQMDSDKDGKSNGEELGDPNCTWQPGQTPDGNAIGHPGICEPVGDARCSYQNFACNCFEHCSGVDGYP
ncbi:temptin-like [Mytilus californianus]|uniref:temptin-like n=1 Tax=Mytilus californianus TaxID=6549 RepID=UPI002247B3F8|nr:temptin-like [Mytilus californianus]